jgi:hypothetical protein
MIIEAGGRYGFERLGNGPNRPATAQARAFVDQMS